MRSATAGVLPLPEIVHFPFTLLPIMVVVPNYVKLIEHCLKHDLPLVITYATPIAVEDKEIYEPKRIGTLGKINVLERFQDGSIKIALEGLHKVELGSVLQHIPFTLQMVNICQDGFDTNKFQDGALSRIKIRFHDFLKKAIPNNVERERFEASLTNIFSLVHYACAIVIKENDLKQSLLELNCFGERINLLDTYLSRENEMDKLMLSFAVKEFENLNYQESVQIH